jgi:phosphopantothenoylcysteine decarboxylase/phosphopantothenate--cysteine ligase
VEPGEGYLACGWIGKGRLAEPADVVAAAIQMLTPVDSVLRGRRVLVTAGPTCEDIDAVRYVSNRSSGRMGFAIAAEARRRGARVTLVAGPTAVVPPESDETIRVRSAADMHAAVMQHAIRADVVVMAAAVADYAPSEVAATKLAKTDSPLTLRLERTRDILADLGRMPSRAAGVPLLVGFAAETDDVLTKAREKRTRKGVDVIVANDVSRSDAGFDVSTNAVTIIGADGEQEVPVESKTRVAAIILDRIERLIQTRSAPAARA